MGGGLDGDNIKYWQFFVKCGGGMLVEVILRVDELYKIQGGLEGFEIVDLIGQGRELLI